jgi:hypothetical protein
VLKLLWDLTRGNRLNPWKSPYLLWRLETYTGLPAKDITFKKFWELCWTARRDLLRYLLWASRIRT